MDAIRSMSADFTATDLCCRTFPNINPNTAFYDFPARHRKTVLILKSNTAPTSGNCAAGHRKASIVLNPNDSRIGGCCECSSFKMKRSAVHFYWPGNKCDYTAVFRIFHRQRNTGIDSKLAACDIMPIEVQCDAARRNYPDAAAANRNICG